jgi:putative membrane protein
LLQQMLFYFFLALCALILISTVFSWLSWFKFRYRLEAGELYVERGVFVKKKRYIQKKRVQAIHISAGLWQRLFGLVKVSIDTAGGGMEAEAEFVAVTRAEAVRIRAELLKELKEEEHSGQNDGELNEAQGEMETETETKPLTDSLAFGYKTAHLCCLNIKWNRPRHFCSGSSIVASWPVYTR